MSLFQLSEFLWKADAKIELKEKDIYCGIAFVQDKVEKKQEQTHLYAGLIPIKGVKEERGYSVGKIQIVMQQ